MKDIQNMYIDQINDHLYRLNEAIKDVCDIRDSLGTLYEMQAGHVARLNGIYPGRKLQSNTTRYMGEVLSIGLVYDHPRHLDWKDKLLVVIRSGEEDGEFTLRELLATYQLCEPKYGKPISLEDDIYVKNFKMYCLLSEELKKQFHKHPVLITPEYFPNRKPDKWDIFMSESETTSYLESLSKGENVCP